MGRTLLLHSPLNQCCVNFCLPPTDKSTQQISIIWLGWLNAWAFVCELSGSGFESRCFQLRLLIQKFLKYIKKNNNFWFLTPMTPRVFSWQLWSFWGRYIKRTQKFYNVFRKTFWVSSLLPSAHFYFANFRYANF